jgi:hypothetical protein
MVVEPIRWMVGMGHSVVQLLHGVKRFDHAEWLVALNLTFP